MTTSRDIVQAVHAAIDAATYDTTTKGEYTIATDVRFGTASRAAIQAAVVSPGRLEALKEAAFEVAREAVIAGDGLTMSLAAHLRKQLDELVLPARQYTLTPDGVIEVLPT